MADSDKSPGSADDARLRPDDEASDGSLLRLYRHGDQDAARLLYLRYAGRLRALARSRTAHDLAGRVDDDDIVQSVFGSFFRGVIHGAYDVPAGEELWNLFLVITLNKIRAKGEHHRAAKRDVRQTVGGEAIAESPDPLSSEGQTVVLLKMAVGEALDRLPHQHAQAVRLRLEGYEVSEIAGITGRSKRSVERLLQESLERLGRLLDD
ncbi:MAG: RNA polymerase sigma factor [Planctomycetia bacterium]|nr:RNA polymerase sigma factor [Planctomycetia bacterium]